jgi:uncharacterized protein
MGALLKNFIVGERKKKLSCENQYKDTFFWRNTQQAEIDYLEVINQQIEAFEIKYSPKAKVHFTKSFTEKYHPISTQVIHSENFWEFLL